MTRLTSARDRHRAADRLLDRAVEQRRVDGLVVGRRAQPAQQRQVAVDVEGVGRALAIGPARAGSVRRRRGGTRPCRPARPGARASTSRSASCWASTDLPAPGAPVMPRMRRCGSVASGVAASTRSAQLSTAPWLHAGHRRTPSPCRCAEAVRFRAWSLSERCASRSARRATPDSSANATRTARCTTERAVRGRRRHGRPRGRRRRQPARGRGADAPGRAREPAFARRPRRDRRGQRRHPQRDRLGRAARPAWARR